MGDFKNNSFDTKKRQNFSHRTRSAEIVGTSNCFFLPCHVVQMNLVPLNGGRIEAVTAGRTDFSE